MKSTILASYTILRTFEIDEALTNCQNNFRKLQEKYNPDHISM